MESRSGTDFARQLRQRQTRAESLLWQALRGRRLEGWKFRRQHQIQGYFADFACEALFIAIELDGAVHDEDENQLNDYLRQQEIEALGWCVMRFRNEQVIGALSSVLDAIREQARLAGSVTPHPPVQLR